MKLVSKEILVNIGVRKNLLWNSQNLYQENVTWIFAKFFDNEEKSHFTVFLCTFRLVIIMITESNSKIRCIEDHSNIFQGHQCSQHENWVGTSHG